MVNAEDRTEVELAVTVGEIVTYLEDLEVYIDTRDSEVRNELMNRLTTSANAFNRDFQDLTRKSAFQLEQLESRIKVLVAITATAVSAVIGMGVFVCLK